MSKHFEKQLDLISQAAIKRAAHAVNIASGNAVQVNAYNGSRMDVEAASLAENEIAEAINKMKQAYVVQADSRAFRRATKLQEAVLEAVKNTYSAAQSLLKDNEAFGTKRDVFRDTLDRYEQSALLVIENDFKTTPLKPLHARVPYIEWIIVGLVGAAFAHYGPAVFAFLESSLKVPSA